MTRKKIKSTKKKKNQSGLKMKGYLGMAPSEFDATLQQKNFKALS